MTLVFHDQEKEAACESMKQVQVERGLSSQDLENL